MENKTEERGDLPSRQAIAKLSTARCMNCYSKLPGYNVYGEGWHWLTPNVGPLCDGCFKEVQEAK